MLKQFTDNYLKELKNSLDKLPLDKLGSIADLLKVAYENDRHIFVLGNGGSAATASHFVGDFSQGINIPGRKRFKVVGLTDNVPMMTALANDFSYEDIFCGQLEALLGKDDLVIAFTGSGNSKNVLKAIEFANKNGAKTIAFTGFDGGQVKDLAQLALIVPSNNMERVEDLHLVLEHILHLYFRKKLASQG